jgi:GTP-binding protein
MENLKAVIIGRPNVWKSSLFNRIAGERKAIVHDVAGTTRDIISETIEVGDKCFELFDTAGYLKENEPLSKAALEKVMEAVKFADLLVFVVDGNVPPTKEDLMVTEVIRKSGKEVLLVINKIDNGRREKGVEEYQKLGFKNLFVTSVIHNVGMGELIAEITKRAGCGTKKEKPEVRVAICGRPNVGKSSLLNKLVGEERAIVSDIPGTTRDVVSAEILGEDFSFSISDTAGARKPGKIGKAFKKGEPVERFSFLRTQREIEKSDIVLIVIDSSERIAAQDLHIAGMAKESGKGIVIIINKWDLVKDVEQDEFLGRLRREFNFMIWVPAIFVSAKTGRNVTEIQELIKKVAHNQRQEINTSKLNRILEDFLLHNPPRGIKNMRPKMFFASQVAVVPPTFAITTKFHEFVHFSWRRGFENELRRHFDFTGTPVKIEFRSK